MVNTNEGGVAGASVEALQRQVAELQQRNGDLQDRLIELTDLVHRHLTPQAPDQAQVRPQVAGTHATMAPASTELACDPSSFEQAGYTSPVDRSEPSAWSRRALLLGAAGAAAGAAHVAATGSPAAAAAGDAMLLGRSNNAGASNTTVTSSGSTVLAVFNDRSAGTGVYGETRSGNGFGMRGVCNEGIGVAGQASVGLGVDGFSTSNVGVRGRTNGGVGVQGISSTGRGVSGEGVIGVYATGITAVNATGTTGVYATGTTGSAVFALGETDFGLRAEADSPAAIGGYSPSNPGAILISGDGAALRLSPGRLNGVPTEGTWNIGDFVVTRNREVWLCTGTGTGDWRLLGSPASSGAYVPLAPTRVYDSREQGGPLVANTQRVINVGIDINTGTRVIPGGTRAIAANVTVAGTTSNSGYVALTPGDAQALGTSTINWTARNATLANGVILTTDTLVRLKAWAVGGGTELIIDVAGYFAQA